MVDHAPPPDTPGGSPFPVATYRLQLRPGFGFTAAAATVPYLARLGVSDCYLSPIFAARAGSGHGYDVCDHGRVNPELGGDDDFAALQDALAQHGLGAMLDLVPNHMGIDPRTNRWWRDVLENGPSSPYAAFFDIDWDPVKAELKDRVLLPILGDQYGAVLERGELRLCMAEGALELHYFDHRLPLNPRQAPRVLGQDLGALQSALGDANPHVREFLSILTALQNLPPYVTRDFDQVIERQREKEIARERLARLIDASAEIRLHVERCLSRANGVPGAPASFALLHDLLERQAFRLAYWRTAFDEINYRRFFDVNDLAGLRTEHPRVFEETHALVRRLAARAVIRGLRVDHPDGLYDPRQYFERLRAIVRPAPAPIVPPATPAGGEIAGVAPADGAPDAAGVYLAVEKILTAGETLPADWPVEGTTGYTFLNTVNGLFVDRSGLGALRRIRIRLTGDRVPFAETAYECKKLIMLTSLASELNVLAHLMNRLSEASWRTRDFTLNSCRKALLEFVACLPVYRTYVTEAGASRADRVAIQQALALARSRNPAMEPTIFAFLESLVLPSVSPTGPGIAGPAPEACLAFAMKLQQYTGPVHAKGIEDTAFYRYNVLTSLNEVGGDPRHGAVDPRTFHEANRRRLADWPREMIATGTHDTKRGEDHRARIDVLSEIPDAWRRAVGHWMRINAGRRTLVDGDPAPSRNDEYLFYQALVGAWPPGTAEPVEPVPSELVARMTAFMVKAVREAKTHSSWINPNAAYERAVQAFVEGVLAGPETARFLAAFGPLQRDVAQAGVVNSLAQLVLKVASPGVADFYQGSESWDLSLVDPDNRRPVDFDLRREWLDDLDPLVESAALDRAGSTTEHVPATAAQVADLLASWPDGRIKLFLTTCGLRLRRRHPALFLHGDYIPLRCDDVGRDHLVAFARRHRRGTVIALAPRLTHALAGPAWPVPVGLQVWGTTRVLLPPGLVRGRFRNVITGESVETAPVPGEVGLFAADVLRTCPVALLWLES